MDEPEDSTEACGRCAMSSVSGVMGTDRDPFAGDRIEVDETDLRTVSPSVWLGRLKRRLDDWASRVTYGR